MNVQPLPSRRLPDDAAPAAVPKVPTVVVTAWKGGVWKSSLAVALAERLAFAGLRVALLVTDSQQDARARLGIGPADPDPIRVQRGDGSMVCAGLAGPQAADALYRHPERLGAVDLAVVDTAPSRHGTRLPGTLMIVPVADADSARNNVAALLDAPANCRIVLVRTGGAGSSAAWAGEAGIIADALGRHVQYAPAPLPPSSAVAEAHAAGRSVWCLPRRGRTKTYLEGIEVLAEVAWRHARKSDPLPPPPPFAAAEAFIAGWDDAGADD